MIDVVFLQGAGAGAHAEDALLAASLGSELGDGFRIDFPEMPREDDPDYERFRPVIADAISRADAPIVVGHSLGGYFLVKYLAEERPDAGIRAICLIAAPYPSGDADWTFDGFELPEGFGDLLPAGIPILLFASEDDDVVPFAHRDRYAAAIPRAATRTTTGGHQLGNDLGVVARDLLAAVG
jgi:predicted alpha/beta hydrolase family esterase